MSDRILDGWSSVHCSPVKGSDIPHPRSGWVDVPTLEAVQQVAREEAIKVFKELSKKKGKS